VAKISANVRDRVRVRIIVRGRVRFRVRVKVRVSVNNNNLSAGELTEKYHSAAPANALIAVEFPPLLRRAI